MKLFLFILILCGCRTPQKASPLPTASRAAFSSPEKEFVWNLKFQKGVGWENATFTVLVSRNLETWTEVASWRDGDDLRISKTNVNAAFYRVEATSK